MCPRVFVLLYSQFYKIDVCPRFLSFYSHTVMKIILIPPPECVPPHNLGLKYSPFFDKKYLRTLLLFKKVKTLVKEYLHTWEKVYNPHIWVSTERLRSFFTFLDLFFKKSKQRNTWKDKRTWRRKVFASIKPKSGGKLVENWR